MGKKNTKIKTTLDYAHFMGGFLVSLILTVFTIPLFIILAVFEKTLAILWIVMAIIFGVILVPTTAYCGYKLFFVVSGSDKYVYVEVPTENVSIYALGLLEFKDRLFSVKVVFDGKEYISSRVVNARSLAAAQRRNKLEIGIDTFCHTIVIVSPAGFII